MIRPIHDLELIRSGSAVSALSQRDLGGASGWDFGAPIVIRDKEPWAAMRQLEQANSVFTALPQGQMSTTNPPILNRPVEGGMA